MKVLRSWLPAIVWMVVIFLLSSRESTTVSKDYWLNFMVFKILHLIEYAILFVLYRRAVHHSGYAFLLTVLYAVTDEIHQTTVPTREGRLRDVIIDAVGALTAWYTTAQLLPKAPGILKKWGRKLLAPGKK